MNTELMFIELPTEILIMVFDMCNYTSLVNLKQINTFCNDIISNDKMLISRFNGLKKIILKMSMSKVMDDFGYINQCSGVYKEIVSHNNQMKVRILFIIKLLETDRRSILKEYLGIPYKKCDKYLNMSVSLYIKNIINNMEIDDILDLFDEYIIIETPIQVKKTFEDFLSDLPKSGSIQCLCGGKISRQSKSSHLKTKIHKKYIDTF